VIHRYQKDGYLDKDLNQRPEGTRRDEERHCTILIKFWKNLEISAATEAACDSYHDWRISRVQQGTGNRAIDRELNTLNNAFRYAKRRGGDRRQSPGRPAQISIVQISAALPRVYAWERR
jgi:hypothetical protein